MSVPCEVMEMTSPCFTSFRKNGLYGTRIRVAERVARPRPKCLTASSPTKSRASRQLKRKRGRPGGGAGGWLGRAGVLTGASVPAVAEGPGRFLDPIAVFGRGGG